MDAQWIPVFSEAPPSVEAGVPLPKIILLQCLQTKECGTVIYEEVFISHTLIVVCGGGGAEVVILFFWRQRGLIILLLLPQIPHFVAK